MDLSGFDWQLDRPIRMKTAEFEREGRLAEQLEYLKVCFRACEKLLQTLDQSRKNSLASNSSESWMLAAIASLPARCIERQIVCLQRIAVLYSRFGNHRRAADYAHRAIRATKSYLSDTSSKSSSIR